MVNEERKSLVGLLYRFLRHGKQLLVVTFVIYLADVALNLVPSVAQQIFSDDIITHINDEWFIPFTIFYTIFLLAQLIVWLALTYHRNKLLGKFNIDVNVKYVWHVLRLPMTVFRHFTPAELVARRQRGQDAATKILDDIVPMMAFFIILSLIFSILIIYCWQLAVVAIASVVISVTSMIMTSRYQSKVARAMEGTQCALQTATISSVQDMETIKSAGVERERFAFWQSKYVQALNRRVKANRTVIMLNLYPVSSQVFGSALVLVMGCHYILQGMITPGILLATQGFVLAAVFPMLKITRTLQKLFSSQAALERMERVLELPCNVPDEMEKPQDISAPYKLQGSVDINDVTFGYDESQPALLEHFSLHVEAGQSVALVGMSGCGKSTVAKLISGLYQPWQGEIFFDGRRQQDIPRIIFTNSVSMISQDAVLFEGTVADNIKMWDTSIEDFSMVLAAHDAQIHDDIASRDDTYNTEIADGGRNFSGGQQQRLEIATALAHEPTILIMDEATSALDAETEGKVMSAIRAMGLTLIIIAHRLSTVRSCDRILVMKYGRVEQDGTHEELMKDHNGLYYKLHNA